MVSRLGLLRPYPIGRRFGAVFVMTVVLSTTSFAGSALAQHLTAPISPAAETMRDAGRQAGIPDVYLPIETALEARENKLGGDPVELKFNGIVGQRLRFLNLQGLANSSSRSITPNYSTPEVPIDEFGRMLVELHVDDDAVFTDGTLAAYDGQVAEVARGYGIVNVWVPADRLYDLAARSDVRFVCHVEPVFTDLGSRLSEGDAIHNADDARACFGVDGTGVTVGVISDGIDNIASPQGSGDLPAVGTPGATGSGDEGTAMLEIVADLAPGATLNFASGGGGTAGMVNAINALAGVAGIDVITDDLAHPQEPLFEDGPIAQAKQAAFNAGIFYTCSAGNRGNQHYQGNFSGLGPKTFGSQDYDNPHDFGGGDYRLSITLNNGSNDLYLQWAELFGTADIDIDLFIVDGAGNILASSTGGQSGSQNPAETISFNSAGGNASIIVDYVDGGAAPNVWIDLRSFTIQFNEFVVPQGSLNGASRQTQVYAAGAANASASTTVTSYSSRGPIQHFFPAPLTRMKPDGVGIDGVTVTGAGCFGCANPCPPVPGTCTFFGTSAATPHVAALAALLLDQDGTLSPTQVRNVLNSTATDIDAPGVDNNAGAGLLDIQAAICSLDNTPPTVEATVNDASVDADCQATVSFRIVVRDASCLSFANVGYNVSIPGGNAALGGISSSGSIAGDSLVVTGTFPVSDLTSCPALVNLTVNAADDCGNAASTVVVVGEVVDDTPPDITCPEPIIVECTESGGTPADDPQLIPFFTGVSATDNCDGNPDITNDAPVFFPSGQTTDVIFTAMDVCGNATPCTTSVTVVDTTPPVIGVELSRYELWPPNHKMSEITATVTVTDICDPAPTWVLTSIVSNEPDNGLGDGDTDNDVQEADFGYEDAVFKLRSERSGGGNGRCYTITFTASDDVGNTADSVLCVSVPHDRGGSAVASSGFLSTGAGVDASATAFTIIVPSDGNLDPATVDVKRAYVGNSQAAMRPSSTRMVDVTGDGVRDLALTYSTAGLEAMRPVASKRDPIGLHYRVGDGTDYLVQNIFGLGTPIHFEQIVDGTPGDADQADAVGDRGNVGTGDDADMEVIAQGDAPRAGILRVLAAGHVRVEVFDVRGRRVRGLIDQDMSAGDHVLAWDGRTDGGRPAPSGVYFYRIDGPGVMGTRRVVRVR